jgi:hypothetical protein
MWNVWIPLKGVSFSRGGVRYVWHWTKPQHFSCCSDREPALNLNVVVSMGPWKLARGAMVGKQPPASLEDLSATLMRRSVP